MPISVNPTTRNGQALRFIDRPLRMQVQEMWSHDQIRRDEIADSEAIYLGHWKDRYYFDILRRELVDRFPITHGPLLRMAAPLVNPLKWIASKVGGIYKRAPVRKVDGVDAPKLYDTDHLNLALDEAAQACFALREILVRPILRAKGLRYDLILPSQATVIPDPSDPEELLAVAYCAQERYILWTRDHHGIYLDSSFSTPLYNPGNPHNINPYGVIPFVCVHARYPVNLDAFNFWHHTEALPLTRAAIEMSMGLIQSLNLIKTSSFKQLAVTEGPNSTESDRDFVKDPNAVIELGEGGTAQTLDWQVDPRNVVEAVLKIAEMVGYMEGGVKPDIMRGVASFTSGYERKLAMGDMLDKQDKLRLQWEHGEQRLYDVTRRVVEVERRRPHLSHFDPLPAGELSVEFDDLGPGSNPIEDSRHWHERKDKGTATAWQVIQKVDGVDEEEARRRAEEIHRENARQTRAGLFPPSADDDGEY